jgi:outer membrane lipoprotein-sorting protein
MKIIVNIIKLICKTKILIIIFCISQPTFAEKISLNEINNYINGLTMLQADFEQINSDGSIDTGKLYIRRPGKMRLEYAAPSNALVIVGAGSVSIFDNKFNNTPIQFPLKETPLNLILKKDVNLNTNDLVSGHSSKNQNTHIIIQESSRTSKGKIEIVFKNNPVNLLGWIITNKSDQETTIVLDKLNKEANIPLYLFNIATINND